MCRPSGQLQKGRSHGEERAVLSGGTTGAPDRYIQHESEVGGISKGRGGRDSPTDLYQKFQEKKFSIYSVDAQS